MKVIVIYILLFSQLCAEPIENLERVFLSEDSRSRSSFSVKVRQMTDDALKSGDRNEKLELFLFQGLSDKREEQQVYEDLILSPPRSICAEQLSRLTKYDEYLKTSMGASYRRPIFGFDDDAIGALKNWYSDHFINQSKNESLRRKSKAKRNKVKPSEPGVGVKRGNIEIQKLRKEMVKGEKGFGSNSLRLIIAVLLLVFLALLLKLRK